MFPQTEVDQHYATVQAELMQLVQFGSSARSVDSQSGSNNKPSSNFLAASAPYPEVDSTSHDTPALTFSRKSDQSDTSQEGIFDDSDYSDDGDDMPQTPWVTQAPLHSDREFFLSFQPLTPLSIPRPVSWASDFPSLNNQSFESNFLGLQFDLPPSTNVRIRPVSHTQSFPRSHMSSVSTESSLIQEGATSHVYRSWPDSQTTFQPDLKDDDSHQMTRSVRPS